MDTAVDVPKTEATHVREDEHEHTGVAKDEAAAVTSIHEHTCECCPGRASKTKTGLGAHRRPWRTQAQEAAAITETTHEVDELVDCRAPPPDRWCCVSWQGKDTSSETTDGTAPGETWPDAWEAAAHVEGCADVRGAAHTLDFWGRGKCKDVDEDTDVQDPSKPRCFTRLTCQTWTRWRRERPTR